MQVCPSCGQRLPLGQLGNVACPACGQLSVQQSPDAPTPIARFHHAAEAGYFADLLQQQQIDAEVRQHQDFSALDGARPMVFVLLVPAEESLAAAELIQQELQADSSDDAEGSSRLLTGQLSTGELRTGEPLRWWQPVALMLVAGGIACWAGGTLEATRTPAFPSGGPLWDLLSESDQPLVGRDEQGQARRRVRFDQRQRRLIVEDDQDGDGRFETRRIFFHPGERHADVN